MHDAPQDVLVDAYPEEEYWQDLLQGHRRRDRRGARAPRDPRLVARAGPGCAATAFASSPRCRARCTLARTNAFFMGGGKALVNAYYRSAQRSACRSATTRRSTRSSCATAASLRPASASERIEARACVLAAGGFESNREWLREAWGVNERGEYPADNFLIRGTRFNTGVLLRFMIDAGADTIGDPTQAHMVAIDARAPLYDGGICTRIDCVSLGRRGQSRCRALLRRRRGLLAQALCDLGPPGRAAAGADRLFDHRCEGGRPLHAAGVSRHDGATRLPELARALGARRGALHADARRVQRGVPAGHVRPHGARRLRHRRPDAAQDALGAADRYAAVLRLSRCGRASRSPISASRSTRRRRFASAASRAPTSSSRAR